MLNPRKWFYDLPDEKKYQLILRIDHFIMFGLLMLDLLQSVVIRQQRADNAWLKRRCHEMHMVQPTHKP